MPRSEVTVEEETGKKLIVTETPEEIAALVVEFRRRAAAGPQVLRRS